MTSAPPTVLRESPSISQGFASMSLSSSSSSSSFSSLPPSPSSSTWPTQPFSGSTSSSDLPATISLGSGDGRNLDCRFSRLPQLSPKWLERRVLISDLTDEEKANRKVIESLLAKNGGCYSDIYHLIKSEALPSWRTPEQFIKILKALVCFLDNQQLLSNQQRRMSYQTPSLFGSMSSSSSAPSYKDEKDGSIAEKNILKKKRKVVSISPPNRQRVFSSPASLVVISDDDDSPNDENAKVTAKKEDDDAEGDEDDDEGEEDIERIEKKKKDDDEDEDIPLRQRSRSVALRLEEIHSKANSVKEDSFEKKTQLPLTKTTATSSSSSSSSPSTSSSINSSSVSLCPPSPLFSSSSPSAASSFSYSTHQAAKDLLFDIWAVSQEGRLSDSSLDQIIPRWFKLPSDGTFIKDILAKQKVAEGLLQTLIDGDPQLSSSASFLPISQNSTTTQEQSPLPLKASSDPLDTTTLMELCPSKAIEILKETTARALKWRQNRISWICHIEDTVCDLKKLLGVPLDSDEERVAEAYRYVADIIDPNCSALCRDRARKASEKLEKAKAEVERIRKENEEVRLKKEEEEKARRAELVAEQTRRLQRQMTYVNYVLQRNEERERLSANHKDKRNPFYVLGIDPQKTDKVNMGKGQRKLRAMVHPDKFPLEDAEVQGKADQAFKIVNAACTECLDYVLKGMQVYFQVFQLSPFATEVFGQSCAPVSPMTTTTSSISPSVSTPLGATGNAVFGVSFSSTQNTEYSPYPSATPTKGSSTNETSQNAGDGDCCYPIPSTTEKAEILLINTQMKKGFNVSVRIPLSSKAKIFVYVHRPNYRNHPPSSNIPPKKDFLTNFKETLHTKSSTDPLWSDECMVFIPLTELQPYKIGEKNYFWVGAQTVTTYSEEAEWQDAVTSAIQWKKTTYFIPKTVAIGTHIELTLKTFRYAPFVFQDQLNYFLEVAKSSEKQKRFAAKGFLLECIEKAEVWAKRN